MSYQDEKIVNCSEFEELLSEYLDGTLAREIHKAVAAHALRCPLCHALLNDVKSALDVCHDIAVPKPALTKLEARILAMTMPETAMACEEFEQHLTDYLDGFLPARLFHRWERHAVLCDSCTDLPGAVVRSIAACYTYKNEEMPLPEGLHERILQTTIGTAEAKAVRASWISQVREWARNVTAPISLPQLAPVAMMLIFAVFILTQTVSAGGGLSSMYQKSFELAGQTYRQGADVVLGKPSETVPPASIEPIQGDYVNQEGKQ